MNKIDLPSFICLTCKKCVYSRPCLDCGEYQQHGFMGVPLRPGLSNYNRIPWQSKRIMRPYQRVKYYKGRYRDWWSELPAPHIFLDVFEMLSEGLITWVESEENHTRFSPFYLFLCKHCHFFYPNRFRYYTRCPCCGATCTRSTSLI